MTYEVTAGSSGVRPGIVVRRFQEFIRLEAASGILLLVTTLIALIWANSPWRASYTGLWESIVTVDVAGMGLSKPLILWINDGLMALFFFVVGLEIKREILVGELASLRQAALPIAAALGGMVLPAALYTLLNLGSSGSAGWGIPMATDIAFALGVMALLGSRVPLSLKVFLTALAIADDIGAVLVIAIFYTTAINWLSLAIGLGLVVLLALTSRFGARATLWYSVVGLIVWVAFLKSGVHATIAGVLVAMSIPAQTRINERTFLSRSRAILDEFDQADTDALSLNTNETQQGAVQSLETLCTEMQSPMQGLEHALHPWVSYVIMPVFALANAGVVLESDLGSAVSQPVTLGILAGLLIGKPLGITLFAWLAVRSGLATRPADISWRQIHGAGWLGGIGFTMALFVSTLAFTDAELIALSKVGILAASVIAGLIGSVILWRAAPHAQSMASDATSQATVPDKGHPKEDV